jgi:hypothetical protein
MSVVPGARLCTIGERQRFNKHVCSPLSMPYVIGKCQRFHKRVCADNKLDWRHSPGPGHTNNGLQRDRDPLRNSCGCRGGQWGLANSMEHMLIPIKLVDQPKEVT